MKWSNQSPNSSSFIQPDLFAKASLLSGSLSVNAGFIRTLGKMKAGGMNTPVADMQLMTAER